MGGHDGIGGITFLASGSWRQPQQGAGFALSSSGCKLTNPGIGIYNIELQQPANERDMMAGFTWLDVPRDYSFALIHVNDTLKQFRFHSAEDPGVNASFSFILTKGDGHARP